MNERVALPARWSARQRLKNTIIYYCLAGLIASLRRVPYFILLAVSTTLGGLGFFFAWPDRRRAVAQLRAAMPEGRSPRWTIFKMFCHFGTLAADWLKIERFTRPGSPLVAWENFEVMEAALAEGRGALVVVPHLGNWELAAQALCHRGVRCTTVAKRLYDPRLTLLVEDFRRQSGLICLWRGEKSVRDEMRDVLRRGEVLGMLIDQDTKTRSVFVPFFHAPAATPVIPAELAIEAEAACVFAYGARQPGGRYVIHFERVERPSTGNPIADAIALTAAFTQKIEATIRRYPHQWVWLHNRWKQKPKPGDGIQS